MKKFFLPLLCLLLIGCGTQNQDVASNQDQLTDTSGSQSYEYNPTIDTSGKIIEIPEKMFATQMTELTVNKKDYLGKTISFEGAYEEADYGTIVYKMAGRQTNGCCGTDGWAGLELEGDTTGIAINDWVRVTGILEEYDENGNKYLRLKDATVEKLSTRGLEFVTQ